MLILSIILSSLKEHNECYAEAKLTKELIDTIALASMRTTPRPKIPTLSLNPLNTESNLIFGRWPYNTIAFNINCT